MLDHNHPIAKLAREDVRYNLEAYAFLFDALRHAHTVLGMGAAPEPADMDESTASEASEASEASDRGSLPDPRAVSTRSSPPARSIGR